MDAVAAWFVLMLLCYALIGVAFAILFVLRGVHVVDPVATNASFAFRLAILPGTAAIWPVLLTGWVRARN